MVMKIMSRLIQTAELASHAKFLRDRIWPTTKPTRGQITIATYEHDIYESLKTAIWEAEEHFTYREAKMAFRDLRKSQAIT